MTMPSERTRALMAAAEFLEELRFSADTPAAIRAQAISVLPRIHRSTIFPVEVERLKTQRADILVTHEAPSSHPHGYADIDELARQMGVRTTFHGHHHDQLDYSAERARLGFTAFGVGLRGIADMTGQVVRAGELDPMQEPRC